MVLILRLPKVPFQKLPFVSRTDGGEGDGGTTGIRGGGSWKSFVCLFHV